MKTLRFYKMNWKHFQVLECDVLEQLHENNFIENCLEILVDFCNSKDYKLSFGELAIFIRDFLSSSL